MNKKYGKPLGDLIGIKHDFFDNNDANLAMADDMADALCAQPVRKVCKMCGEKITGKKLMDSHKMGYYLCENCHHLNSEHEDTDAFAQKVYITDNYANNYTAADVEKYEKRLDSIYIPKAQFLIDALKNDGIDVSDIRLLDDGAGSGYFVRAMRKLGADAEGIEISTDQVKFANDMAKEAGIEEPILKQIDSCDITDYIKTTDRPVLSAIGVLEHIISLQETFDAIRDNKNIKYLYISVPMFGFSALFEGAFQKCYNRHLGGTHTHLFSDDSLKYMADRIGFEIHSSWKFGSDMMDLYRFLCVSLQQNGNDEAVTVLADKFLPIIDKMQLVVDESEFASEIHMLLKRK